MFTHRIDNNETFVTNVTVRESDPYSRSILVRFDRHYVPEDVRGCNEMYLTPDELEKLALFMIERARAIRLQG